ncbi:MAG: glycosyltransferase, partial [Bacteroidaceae bacterium]|nr:glycosyltransferase [Bacteroidaceae bacterium]
MNHQEAELRGTGNPLITIATVTYNADASLQATLDSVAGQDYARIEHIIVDGRSKDQTLGIIHRYVEDNTIAAIPHNIRLVCEPDEGLYDAMNKAIRLAAGDYRVFLNAGDRLHATTTISEIAAKADWIRGDYTNPAILYGETDLVDSDGKFIRHRRLRSPEKLTWKSFRAGMLVCHQSFYVRTDIAQENLYDLQYKFS